MSGSLQHLNAVGAQDTELTINPTRTFFKSIHKRHTPFSQEPKTITFNGTAAYSKTVNASIPRSGDLLAKLYLVIDLGDLNSGAGGAGVHYVEDAGRAIISKVTLEAGGVQYDCLWPELMHAWEELSVLSERQLGRLTGKAVAASTLETWAQFDQRFYVPLNFYFQNDYSAAVPIISLHLTDLKVCLTLKALADIVDTSYTTSGNDGDLTVELMGEFIYLDDAERDLFARTRHKYLITQHQRIEESVAANATSLNVSVTLNHPTKEFIVMYRSTTNETAKNWFNFEGSETGKYVSEAFLTMGINLNSNERVSPRDPLYFRILQNAEHHTRIPDKHIYVYSFAIAPESNSPSGSLNLSRIENCNILFTFTSSTVVAGKFLIFARSINVVSIFSGVASLRWSS